MNPLPRILLTAAVLATGLWTAFYWVEADKEIRILCGTFAPGTELQELRSTLATGLYLRSRLILDGTGDRLVVDSRRNLGTSRCIADLDAEVVRRATYARTLDLPRLAAGLALGLFAGMAVFQITLAAGAPLGAFAWGGRHRRLPPGLRRGSAVSALIFLAGTGVMLAFLGSWAGLGPGLLGSALWILALLFGLSALANSASESAKERWTGTPVAVILCLASTLVALAL